MITKLATYYHTLKYLKISQVFGQITFRVKNPKSNLKESPSYRNPIMPFTAPIKKIYSLSEGHHMTYLNQRHDIRAKYIWSHPRLDKLWLYHLHYFDILTLNESRVTERELIKRWINENKPGNSLGWDPYPLSLRLVNWIKWHLLGNPLSKTMLQSLAMQARYLTQRLEVHLLGNHLLANAKALMVAGIFFSDDEAKKWFMKGFNIFHTQLSEQILSDGGHFELSPMYHSIILEDLLDVFNFFQTYGRQIPHRWLAICEKMFNWLQIMCHPDHQIAFFNDSVFNIAPDLQTLVDYHHRLGFMLKLALNKPITSLASSGYVRLQLDNKVLIADVAEVGATYQPGHAHADTLSFELSINKERVFVNSGISTYRESAERSQQRSTIAHNTLTLNHKNSSQIWKSFRVAKRANVFDIQQKEDKHALFLSASHNGYFSNYHVIHTRTWVLCKKKLLIDDKLTGTGRHFVQIAFHCHPDITLTPLRPNQVVLFNKLNKPIAYIKSEYAFSIVDSTYHPMFNYSLPNKKIILENEFSLPICIMIEIKWE